MKQATMPALGLSAWIAGAALAALAPPAHGQGDSWQPQAPLPVARRLLAAATEGGQVYTFGGCGSPCFDPLLHPDAFEETLVEVFDPQANSWARRGPMPTVLFGAAAVAPGNGRIYTLGGTVSGNVVQEYDPHADDWRLRAPMPTARFGLAAVALDGKIYALGGSGPSAALEIYDPAANRWTTGPPMPTARVYLAAAALDGRIYAVGGSPDCCGGAVTDVVEVYDPTNNSWTSAAPLPLAQQLSGAVAVNGKIYTFGGFIPGLGAQGATYEYDPQAGSWAARSPMPTARDQAGVASVDGQTYVLGGATDCHCQALPHNEKHCASCPPPLPPPDLEISLAGDRGPLCPGELARYRVTATNHGPAAVVGARVRGTFPAITSLDWTCSPAPGASCLASGSGPLSELVTLPAGASVVYTVSGTVREDLAIPLAGKLFVGSAEILPPAGTEDPDLSNNLASLGTRVVATADLVLDLSDGVSEVAAESLVLYEITVTNRGPCPVEAVVSDVFPPALSDGLWACVEPAACSPGLGPAPVSTVVRLAVDGQVVLRASGRVRAEPSPPFSPDPPRVELANTATVAAPGGGGSSGSCLGICDPDEGNNQATDVDRILPSAPAAADLAIEKTSLVDGPLLFASDGFAYRIVVTNLGPAAVVGALVRDQPPPAFESPFWTCNGTNGGGCSAEGEGGIDDGVELPVGGTVTYLLMGVVGESFLGPLANTATVSVPAGFVDPDLANNTSTAHATVFSPGPGFRAAKIVSSFSASDGIVVFTVVLLNPGPAAQQDNQGSELVDNLPVSLDLLTAAATSGTVVTSGNTVVWDGAIPAGGTVTLTITAQLREGFTAASVCNRAKLFIDTDGDSFNDEVFASDDPALPGTTDPTCLRADGVPAIPALSPLAGALFILALLAAALARLRSMPA